MRRCRRGALAPSQSYFYTANAAAGNQANPETATAEQIGIVRQSQRYGVSLDVYNVNFDNYVTTVAATNGDTVYENSGSVRYRGIESEAHLSLGAGLTAVGNASVIRAIYLDSDITSPIQMAGDTIPYAPSYIALAGLTYGNGPWSGSLLTKFVGTAYQGKNGSADGDIYRVNPYSYTNATGTRHFFFRVHRSETAAAHGGGEQHIRFPCDHRQLRPLDRGTQSDQRPRAAQLFSVVRRRFLSLPNLGYAVGPWAARLIVSNMFDAKYFIDNYQTLFYGNAPGAPTNFSLTLRRTF